MPQAPQMTSCFMRLRATLVTIVVFGIRKSSLQTCSQGIIFSDLGDLKSGEEAADFFLSDQRALSLIPLPPPPNKTILFTVFFPDSLFTTQIIYAVGLIYVMKESVSPVVLLSNKPKLQLTALVSIVFKTAHCVCPRKTCHMQDAICIPATEAATKSAELNCALGDME